MFLPTFAPVGWRWRFHPPWPGAGHAGLWVLYRPTDDAGGRPFALCRAFYQVTAEDLAGSDAVGCLRRAAESSEVVAA